MNLLILSQYYAPEPVPKPHELATELVARGYNVTVLTAQPNYPSGKIYPGYKALSLRTENIDGVTIHRLPLFPNHSLSVVRILNYGSFVLSALFWGPRLVRAVDLLYVYHPPLSLALPARYLSWRLDCPYVYAVHDLWPESIAAVGVQVGRTAKVLFRRLEAFAYTGASRVLVANPGFRGHLVKKGVPPELLSYVPNWADEALYHPSPPSERVRAEINAAGRFVVLYGGNLGSAQGLDTLLQAATQLRERTDILFVLVGDGVERSQLESYVRDQNLTNVRFLGGRSSAAMAEYLSAADILYCGLRDHELFAITIPSKIFSYMACGKPILASLTGDGAAIVQEGEIGRVCPPGDARALGVAIKELQQLAPEQRHELGRRARSLFESRYSKKILVNEHERIFLEVIETQRRSHTKQNQQSQFLESKT